jgi:hypothetical protein
MTKTKAAGNIRTFLLNFIFSPLHFYIGTLMLVVCSSPVVFVFSIPIKDLADVSFLRNY